jgi:hypothetical protein
VINCVVDIVALINRLPGLDTLIIEDCSYVASPVTAVDTTSSSSPQLAAAADCCKNVALLKTTEDDSFAGTKAGAMDEKEAGAGLCPISTAAGGVVSDICRQDSMNKLQQLVIHDYDGLLDETLARVVGLCPLLKKLDLTEIDGVSLYGIHEVINSCHHLESLKMAHCLGLKERIHHQNGSLSSSKLALSNLDVTGCRSISWDAILDLVSVCPRLQRVKACKLDITEHHVMALLDRYTETQTNSFYFYSVRHFTNSQCAKDCYCPSENGVLRSLATFQKAYSCLG